MNFSNAVEISNNGLSYKQLIVLFNAHFLSLLNTRLESNHSEPVYFPATKSTPARVCFRADYASSALHEVAHWCIAGEKRRQQIDYGYWYEPDGRSIEKQQKFEKVEVKPQALEWMFSIAAGVVFRISVDNLDGETSKNSEEKFALAVISQARCFLNSGLPERAQTFYQSLLEQGHGKQAEYADFSLEKLA